MGCCFGKEEDHSYTPDAVTERTGLLDPVGGEGASVRPVTNYTTPGVAQQKGDEQSALNRILHRTANNMVDAGALDSTTLEQQEYMDRAQQYSSRMSNAYGNTQHGRSVGILPVGVAAPQVVLTGKPPSSSDIRLVTTAAELIKKAVQDVKVKHQEDLVVPFGVP